uniref:Uncharacterized protein n=1 Tax=Ananas comosus var. bracteatus TaxID=296719 RepID=A0A6V7P1N6_ANACO|nr:unnamed protein product [Ananas comosus var. bracteatus]
MVEARATAAQASKYNPLAQFCFFHFISKPLSYADSGTSISGLSGRALSTELCPFLASPRRSRVDLKKRGVRTMIHSSQWVRPPKGKARPTRSKGGNKATVALAAASTSRTAAAAKIAVAAAARHLALGVVIVSPAPAAAQPTQTSTTATEVSAASSQQLLLPCSNQQALCGGWRQQALCSGSSSRAMHINGSSNKPAAAIVHEQQQQLRSCSRLQHQPISSSSCNCRQKLSKLGSFHCQLALSQAVDDGEEFGDQLYQLKLRSVGGKLRQFCVFS